MEPPFRFGLERVRELRAHDEERAKELFAASLSQRVRGAAMLRAADEQLHAARTEGLPAQGQPVTAATLIFQQAWVERLERSRTDAELRLRSYEAELESKRTSLHDASRRREVLDRLKQRQREAHRRAVERREGAVLDEIAIGMHRRRSMA